MVKGYSRYHIKSSWLHYIFYWHTRKSKPLLKELISDSLERIIKGVLKDLNCEIRDIDITENSVYLGIKANPKYSPHKIVSKIKAVSSREFREKYPEFRKIPSLWTRSYFVSTYGRNTDINRDMKEYDMFLKRQNKKRYTRKAKEKSLTEQKPVFSPFSDL